MRIFYFVTVGPNNFIGLPHLEVSFVKNTLRPMLDVNLTVSSTHISSLYYLSVKNKCSSLFFVHITMPHLRWKLWTATATKMSTCLLKTATGQAVAPL